MADALRATMRELRQRRLVAENTVPAPYRPPQPLSPGDLRAAVQRASHRFIGFNQQDAHEFMEASRWSQLRRRQSD